MHLVGSIIRK